MKHRDYWEFVRTSRPHGDNPRAIFIKEVRRISGAEAVTPSTVARLNKEASDCRAHEAMLVEFLRVQAANASMSSSVAATEALDWIRDNRRNASTNVIKAAATTIADAAKDL